MGKMVRKRVVRSGTKPASAPAPVREAEIAPDAEPILLPPPVPHPEMAEPLYTMVCWAGEYKSNSWIGLGWAILTHRLWHLFKDGSFKD